MAVTAPIIGIALPSGLRCACGNGQIVAVDPGHEGFRVNLLGESDEGPGRLFALTPERPTVGRCLRCASSAGSGRGTLRHAVSIEVLGEAAD